MVISTFATIILSQKYFENEIVTINNVLNLSLTSLLLIVIAKHKWKNKIPQSSPLWLILITFKLVSIPFATLFFSYYLLSAFANFVSSMCFLFMLVRRRYHIFIVIAGFIIGFLMVNAINFYFPQKEIVEYGTFLSESLFDIFSSIMQILSILFLAFYRQIEDNIKVQTIRGFSNLIAHEVLKPLAIIETQLGLMKNDTNGAISASKGNFGNLTSTCRRVRNRINFIMQNAKLLGSIEAVTRHNTSIKEVLLQCINNYEIDGLIVSLTAHNDILFNGPKILIQCLCNNIVDNAYQYGGRNVKVEITISENYIIFQDNGRGIKPINLEDIFEMFTSSKEYNLGIGLTVCKDIVNSYGGTIKCISLEGHHTTFIIRLPCPVLSVEGK